MATPADFLPDVQPYVSGAPVALIERAITHAAREFCADSGYWREDQLFTTVTDEVAAGQYQLTAAAGVDFQSIVTPVWHLDSPVTLRDAEWLAEHYGIGWRTMTGTQARYCYAVAQDIIQLVPYPTEITANGLRVTAIFAPSLVNPTIGDDVLLNFSEEIGWGATARLKSADANADWYDPKTAVPLRMRFEEAVSRAKSLARAGGQDRRHQTRRKTTSSYF